MSFSQEDIEKFELEFPGMSASELKRDEQALKVTGDFQQKGKQSEILNSKVENKHSMCFSHFNFRRIK